MSYIYHITKTSEAEKADSIGEYVPEKFPEDNFIHCSYARQVAEVANYNFSGQQDLVLYEINRSKLTCPVIDENLDGGVELYPHIYGKLPMAAVERVINFPCKTDGSFDFPDVL